MIVHKLNLYLPLVSKQCTVLFTVQIIILITTSQSSCPKNKSIMISLKYYYKKLQHKSGIVLYIFALSPGTP